MPKQSRQFTKEINPICSTTELHGRIIAIVSFIAGLQSELFELRSFMLNFFPQKSNLPCCVL